MTTWVTIAASDSLLKQGPPTMVLITSGFSPSLQLVCLSAGLARPRASSLRPGSASLHVCVLFLNCALDSRVGAHCHSTAPTPRVICVLCIFHQQCPAQYKLLTGRTDLVSFPTKLTRQ